VRSISTTNATLVTTLALCFWLPPPPATATPAVTAGHAAGPDTDDYPLRFGASDTADPWGFASRECTSFVAWRIRTGLGIEDFTNRWRGGRFGDARNWADNAAALGLPVNDRPVPGSVAVFPPGVDGAGAVGHVGYVIDAGPGTVGIEDYNYADRYNAYSAHRYSRHTVSSAGLSFIHFPNEEKPLHAGTSGLVDDTGTVRLYARDAAGAVHEDRLGPGGAWTWSDLAGTVTGNPLGVTGPDGTVHLLAVSAGGALQQRTQRPGTAWTGWVTVGGDGLTGTPHAVLDTEGVLRVYARRTGSGLTEARLLPDGTWSFAELDGTWSGDPTALVDWTGRIRVYAIDQFGELYERHLPQEGTWSAWYDMGGGPLTGTPAALRSPDGVVRVYVRHRGDGGISEDHLDPGGVWQWYPMGGTWSGDPVAMVDASGGVRVYGLDAAGRLHERYLLPGSSWADWYDMGFAPDNAEPTTLVDNDGTARIFLRAHDSHVAEITLMPDQSWHWQDLGGSLP
jgi:surface antigen